MRSLNYNHVFYFWAVAHAGSIAKAGRLLRLSSGTLSVQLRQLEAAMGGPLFQPAGRKHVLTPRGQAAFAHADAMFSIARDLAQQLETRRRSLTLGYCRSAPKPVIAMLLDHVLAAQPGIRCVFRGTRSGDVPRQLAEGVLDAALIAGQPSGPDLQHALMAQSGIALCACRELAERYRPDFPRSLGDAPMLFPNEASPLGVEFRAWLKQNRIEPRAVGEMEGATMLHHAAQMGLGIVPVPTQAEEPVRSFYGLERIGLATGASVRYFLVTSAVHRDRPALRAIFDGLALPVAGDSTAA